MKFSKQPSSTKRAASQRSCNMQTSLWHLLLNNHPFASYCLHGRRDSACYFFHPQVATALTRSPDVPQPPGVCRPSLCDVIKGVLPDGTLQCRILFLRDFQDFFQFAAAFRFSFLSFIHWETWEGAPLQSRMQGQADSCTTNPVAHATSNKNNR